MDVAPPPQSDPVAGDFALVRELGRGASSVVHLAHQHSLDREVALKRLLRTLSGDLEARARLRREAQVVARLEHPRVVRLFDLIEDGSDLVLVMEYVRGPTVRSLCRAQPPAPSQALAVVADVAAALDYAAARGVTHRDVKPANVFVTSSGRCKLGDFGLARIAGESAMFLSNDGTVHGTPLYMAPEQLRGQDPTPASDVYALSLMALELLSGRHPFSGLTVWGAVEAHLDGGAVSAADASDLPKTTVAVLRDGLAMDSALRPTARELVERLRGAAPDRWLAVDDPLSAPADTGGSAATISGGGLWAEGERTGWTTAQVDDQTWAGTPDATLLGASPLTSGVDEFPAAREAVSIDDQWIRTPSPAIRVQSRRPGLSWITIAGAFAVGVALAIVILVLLSY